jgi:hypothetical protein
MILAVLPHELPAPMAQPESKRVRAAALLAGPPLPGPVWLVLYREVLAGGQVRIEATARATTGHRPRRARRPHKADRSRQCPCSSLSRGEGVPMSGGRI